MFNYNARALKTCEQCIMVLRFYDPTINRLKNNVRYKKTRALEIADIGKHSLKIFFSQNTFELYVS